MIDDTPLISVENSNGLNYQLTVSDLYKSAIKLYLGLHVNNNITFQDVLNIQEGIEEFVMKPIAVLLENCVKDKFNDPLILSSFKKVSLNVFNTFTLCSTEYWLMNWLFQEQYIYNLNKIIINKEITYL